MKKIVLSVFAISMCLYGFAQNNKTTGAHHMQHRVFQMDTNDDVIIPFRSNNNVPLNYSPRLTATQQVIGSTTYDLQSNCASVAGRVYNNGNNIGAGWTGSTDAVTAAWADRGTFVNFSSDNGTTWGPAPAARLEAERRGFGTVDKLGSGEISIAHQYTATNRAPMSLYYRATAGSGAWAKLSDIPGPGNDSTNMLWPTMHTGGANGNSVYVVAITAPAANSGTANGWKGVDGAPLFNRSTDGGMTWDIQNAILPGFDSSHYVRVRANAYSMDVKGDIVAVVSCGAFNDWALWKSTDGGTNWTRTVIMQFPIDKYDYINNLTDVDGDGVADIIPTTDGTCSVVIDNNGTVHCFASSIAVQQTAAGTANIGFDTTPNAILYWNENMGANPPITAAQTPDEDGDGVITDNSATYGFVDGVASMPSAGVDAYNNIYVAYAGVRESTDDGNGVSFRNIFAAASNDNGATWLPAFNVSNSAFDEAVYPCIARDVDAPGCLHVTWLQDAAPGLTANATTPAPSQNDIVYSCVDPIADLGIILGIKENTASVIDISISPNPAADYALVNYNLTKATSIQMEVFNINGQRVIQRTENVTSSGTRAIRIDTLKLSKGVYSVNSKIDGKVYTDKLVVK